MTLEAQDNLVTAYSCLREASQHNLGLRKKATQGPGLEGGNPDWRPRLVLVLEVESRKVEPKVNRGTSTEVARNVAQERVVANTQDLVWMQPERSGQ